jgi:hypothetical protein
MLLAGYYTAALKVSQTVGCTGRTRIQKKNKKYKLAHKWLPIIREPPNTRKRNSLRSVYELAVVSKLASKQVRVANYFNYERKRARRSQTSCQGILQEHYMCRKRSAAREEHAYKGQTTNLHTNGHQSYREPPNTRKRNS